MTENDINSSGIGELKITCQTASSLPVDDFSYFQGDMKKLTDEEYDRLRLSILRLGFFAPVMVWIHDNKHLIIDGHQRVKAVRRMQKEEGLQVGNLPVVSVEAKDIDEAKRKVLAAASVYAEIDKDGLADFIRDLANRDDLAAFTSLPDIDMERFLDDTAGGKGETNSAIELSTNPVTKPGELIVMGDHRLLCGDATKPDDYRKLCGGVKPVLMVTDPPYGVNYDPAWRQRVEGKMSAVRAVGAVPNDDKIDWTEAFQLFTGPVIYAWHAGVYALDSAMALKKAGFELRTQIIWVKQHFALGRGNYHWQHEPCWHAVRKGTNGNWCGDRKQTTTWEIKSLNMMGGNKEETPTGHGTQKPLECMALPIKNNSKRGDWVYDPFLGSGTTLIAAERLGRKCAGMEIDPVYCDVIIQRWMNATGKVATRG